MNASPKTAHTPGPWQCEPFSRYDKSIIILPPGVSVDYDDVDRAEAEANARLIAAAPEMLDALEKIVRATSVPAHKLTDTEFLRASASIALSFAEVAIAKAETR